MNRFRDWLDQARGNLGHAGRSLEMGDHAWACFAAHQAAEAALKGAHLRVGQTAWGHSVLDLLLALPASLNPAQAQAAARLLDRYYIPTRYPDVHPAGSALRYFEREEAEAAVAAARRVVEFCERAGVEG
jgi:HEPN domain-containing protein